MVALLHLKVAWIWQRLAAYYHQLAFSSLPLHRMQMFIGLDPSSDQSSLVGPSSISTSPYLLLPLCSGDHTLRVRSVRFFISVSDTLCATELQADFHLSSAVMQGLTRLCAALLQLDSLYLQLQWQTRSALLARQPSLLVSTVL
jgi:hypothetical protein